PVPRPLGLLALQRAAGNAAVVQQVQRYAVGVPATADHATLMAWMQGNNPYAPDEAARTTARFRYNVTWDHSGESGSWTLTPRDTSTVTVTKSVDMPVWRARDPALQAAWAAGVTALRAHEAQHEGVADTWRTTLLGRLLAFSTSSSAATLQAARNEANTALAAEWQTWLAEHQAEQSALDPYSVVVANPQAPPATP
ncbi:DUF922 domain-containing protein, partial [Nocardioides sp.]